MSPSLLPPGCRVGCRGNGIAVDHRNASGGTDDGRAPPRIERVSYAAGTKLRDDDGTPVLVGPASVEVTFATGNESGRFVGLDRAGSTVAVLSRDGDADDDGLRDAAELQQGADPLRADTDGDGLEDGREVRLGTSPVDDTTDADADGLTTEREVDGSRDCRPPVRGPEPDPATNAPIQGPRRPATGRARRGSSRGQTPTPWPTTDRPPLRRERGERPRRRRSGRTRTASWRSSRRTGDGSSNRRSSSGSSGRSRR
jgi:hypothetical protein